MTTNGSRTIDAALVDEELPWGYFKSSEHPCEGSRFHSPHPLTTKLLTHPTQDDYYLCGTCADNLAIFLSLASKDGALTWPVLREFGNQLRALGQRILAASDGE